MHLIFCLYNCRYSFMFYCIGVDIHDTNINQRYSSMKTCMAVYTVTKGFVF